MPPRRRMSPRIRVHSGETIALGPGKADLLEAIARAGTIRDAATALGMSYMRAWQLVRTMNEAFREPVVELTRGGAGHGRAALTDSGRRALQLYREMEKAAEKAADPAWRELRKLLR